MDYELDVAEDMLEGSLEKEVTPMLSTGKKDRRWVSLSGGGVKSLFLT